jgi:GNAT superfamily N-acetyltransferase
MSATPNIEILRAATAADYTQVIELIRHYLDWCRQRYATLGSLVDESFSYQGLDAELVSLSEAYQSPAGLMLLGRVDGEPGGCVAFRTIGDRICEMKRLFVEPRYQGMGLGRRLCMGLIEVATSRGFLVMRLDSGDRFNEAQALYRSLGFVDIPPFYECPPEFRQYMVFMELALQKAGTAE